MTPLRFLRLLIAPAVAALLLLVVGPAGAAKPEVQLYVVAGVDVPVSVTLDGKSLGDLDAASVLGPLSVTPGEHRFAFEADDWTASTRANLDDASTDVVVHRPADATSDPTVTVFPNDVSPIVADHARLTVAHTAVVPPADVRVAKKVLFANIANGEFVTAEVPGGTYSVDIVPTGGSKPLFGPVDLTVEAGALNRVFAIGRPQDGSMDAVVHVIDLPATGSRPPTSVDAGEAGLVAPDPGDGAARTAGLVAGTWLALGGCLVIARRRRTR